MCIPLFKVVDVDVKIPYDEYIFVFPSNIA